MIFTLILTILDGVTLAQSKSPAIAELIEAKGNVTLQRNGSSRLVQKGEPLYLGDLLVAEKGATAVIQCNIGKTTWTLPDEGLPWGVANTCSSDVEKR